MFKKGADITRAYTCNGHIYGVLAREVVARVRASGIQAVAGNAFIDDGRLLKLRVHAANFYVSGIRVKRLTARETFKLTLWVLTVLARGEAIPAVFYGRGSDIPSIRRVACKTRVKRIGHPRSDHRT